MTSSRDALRRTAAPNTLFPSRTPCCVRGRTSSRSTVSIRSTGRPVCELIAEGTGTFRSVGRHCKRQLDVRRRFSRNASRRCEAHIKQLAAGHGGRGAGTRGGGPPPPGHAGRHAEPPPPPPPPLVGEPRP